MRIIATVLLEKDYVIQTYSYSEKKVIGKPKVVIKHLDEWQIDEIVLIQTDNNIDFLYKNIDSILENCSTPLTVGGGINSTSCATNLIKRGADRVCLQRLIFDNINEIYRIAEKIGGQAITMKIDVDTNSKKIRSICKDLKFLKDFFNQNTEELINNNISDLFFYNVTADGMCEIPKFDFLKSFDLSQFSLILGGGIIPTMTEEIWKYWFPRAEDLSISFSNYLYQKEVANREILEKLNRLNNCNYRILIN